MGFCEFTLIMAFTDMLKPFHGLAVNLNRVVPHGKRAYLSSALTVQGFVNDHILKRFAMLRKADCLVLVAFVVPINTKWNRRYGL